VSKEKASKFDDFRYYRLVSGYSNRVPAITFKFDVDQDTSMFKASFAVCCKDDMFDRSTGRRIAQERMNSGLCVEGTYDREMSLIDNVVGLLNRDKYVSEITNDSLIRLISNVKHDVKTIAKAIVKAQQA